MSTRSPTNADRVRAFVHAAWNDRKLEALDAFLAPGYRDRAYSPGDREGLRQAIGELARALPDAVSAIDDLIADGDTVAVRMTVRGTHRGAFRGHEPSGARVEVKVVRWYRLDDGRIAEHWALFDTAGFLRQIAAVPAP